MLMSTNPVLEDLPLGVKIVGGAIFAFGFAVYVYVSETRRRRRYRAALQRVKERSPCLDHDFVRELGLVPGTKESEIAVGFRRAYAEWLNIPEGALRANSSLTEDSDLTPLGDSLDVVELQMLMEERANVAIPYSWLSAVPAPSYNGNLGKTIHWILGLVVFQTPAPTLRIRVKYYRNHWLAKLSDFYGTVIHASTKDEAIASAKRVAIHKLAERLRRIVPLTAANFIVEEVGAFPQRRTQDGLVN
jgi:hypothetical protein